MEAAADIKEWLHELIDTLWNVNLLSYSIDSYGYKRINRYIMECKSDSQTKSAATTAAN